VNERFTEEEDFQKRTELACELIRSFAPPVPGRVLVDSVYCCAEVIRVAHWRGFPVVGLWKKNRRRAEEVRGWLATLGRLLLWGFQTLSSVSIPKLEQEAILTP
jgi:hypothetical protein